MDLEDKIKFVNALGDVLEYKYEESNLSDEQSEVIKKLRKDTNLSFGQACRLQLEKMYNSDELYSCRCYSGIRLNVFEQNLDEYCNGAGRPDWEELCRRVSCWVEELGSKLYPTKLKSADRRIIFSLFDDGFKFHNLLFDLSHIIPAHLSGRMKSEIDRFDENCYWIFYLYEEFSGDWEGMIERLRMD